LANGAGGCALTDAPDPPRGDSRPGGEAATHEEGEIIRRVRAGDREAFDELVRRYMRRAYGLAYRLLGHREDAEDLVQDAILAALDRIDLFDVSKPFGPWFFRIVVNRGLNARQSRAIRTMEPLVGEEATAEASPLRATERAEVRDRFRAAIERLPERQRAAIEMFDVEGYSSAEIAEALAVSQGTVRWYVHEARRALRQMLAPLTGEEGIEYG
jgi:RNA polymerase sigma-70 factor (ECF subfamily)